MILKLNFNIFIIFIIFKRIQRVWNQHAILMSFSKQFNELGSKPELRNNLQTNLINKMQTVQNFLNENLKRPLTTTL